MEIADGRTKDIDIKLKKIQNLVAKTTVHLLYLLDLLMNKSADNQPFTKSEVQSSTVWCTDVYQFLHVVYTDITSRRRTVIKGGIQPKYKGLCDCDCSCYRFSLWK
jgi:hypothetical protein